MIREIFSLIGSLVLIVLILVLTYYATRWYARRMRQQSGSGKYIRLLDRSTLGTGISVVIVKIAQSYYLLGVGDKSVNFLCTLTDFEEGSGEAPPQQTTPFSAAFRQVLDKVRGAPQGKDGDDRL